MDIFRRSLAIFDSRSIASAIWLKRSTDFWIWSGVIGGEAAGFGVRVPWAVGARGAFRWLRSANDLGASVLGRDAASGIVLDWNGEAGRVAGCVVRRGLQRADGGCDGVGGAFPSGRDRLIFYGDR